MLLAPSELITNPAWKQLLAAFSDVKFKVWNESGHLNIYDQLQSLQLDNLSDFTVDSNGLLQELPTFALLSKGVITDIPWIANFMSYLGIDVFLLNDSNRIFNSSKYFSLVPNVISIKGGEFSKLLSDRDVSGVSSLAEVADYIIRYLNL